MVGTIDLDESASSRDLVIIESGAVPVQEEFTRIQPAGTLIIPFDQTTNHASFQAVTRPYTSCGSSPIDTHWSYWSDDCRHLVDLHGDIQRDSNLIYRATALTEKGELVNGRVRPEGTNIEHDILTGSDSHGRAFPAGLWSSGRDRTCRNWTYDGEDGEDGRAMIGHHDRLSSWNTSWNSSHSSAGCSLEKFNETGGAGRLYCFAAS